MDVSSAGALVSALPARWSAVDIEPAKLGMLLRLCRADRVATRSLREAIEDRLLDLTVRRAWADTNFYRERDAALATELESLPLIDRAVLDRLPTLSREDVQNAGSALHSRWATYSFTSYTSGTTTDRPLLLDRSEQEQLYLSRFFHALGLRVDRPAPGPLVLSLRSGIHGRQLQVPGVGTALPVSVEHPAGLSQAVALLERSFPSPSGPREISAIAGSATMVETLSAELDRRGHPRRRLQFITLGGEYSSAAARRRLGEFWSCPVSDSFSLTELFLSAKLCPRCDLHHFDEFGFAEVIDELTGRRLEEGRGRLLLTGFFPFTQMTPMVRYATGDLVERRIVDCPADPVGYRLLGRKSASAVLRKDDRSVIFGGNEAIEAVEPVAGIRRELLGTEPGPTTKEFGRPCLRIEQPEDGTIAISIAVRGDGEPTEETLRSALLTGLPHIDGRLSPGWPRLEIEAEAPLG